MKLMSVSILLLFPIFKLQAQVFSNVELNSSSRKSVLHSKPVIDSASINLWPSLGDASLTNDGKYMMYEILNQPYNSNTVVIQATHESWRKELVGVKGEMFSSDNKKFVYKVGDTLCFLYMGTNEIRYICHVKSVKYPKNLKGKLVAYYLKNKDKVLALHNIITGKELFYSNVIDFSFDKNGKTLLLKTLIKKDSLSVTTLRLVNLTEHKSNEIWSCKNSESEKCEVIQYSFDELGSQLVFIVQDKRNGKISNSIWYSAKSRVANKIIGNDSPSIPSGYVVSDHSPQFSNNGRYVFFKLKKVELYAIKSNNMASVDIWHYKDAVLQSTQLHRKNRTKVLYSVIEINSNRVINAKEDEVIMTSPGDVTGDFVVIKDQNSITDYWWKWSAQPRYYLLSLKDTTRQYLDANKYSIFSFSINGSYLVYYNTESKGYFSYNLRTKRNVNVSKSASTSFNINDEYLVGELPDKPGAPVGIAGWISNESAVLVYDNYDVWKLNLDGTLPPKNITNGYGLLRKMKFRLIYEDVAKDRGISVNDPVLLSVFDVKSMDNGIYLKNLNKSGDPILLASGQYRIYITQSQVSGGELGDGGMKPIRCQNASLYLVKRQSATEAPNYFLTKDFKAFKQVSFLAPQIKYNWLSVELINWQKLDGSIGRGVLYKPENIDTTKKYPVIINYYQTKSHLLNEFKAPQFSSGEINIPWFVSRGYLVFTPDVQFKVGKIGKSVVNTVITAVQYLSKRSWVDSTKIGIQGHSFGGFETLYLITHSKLFAAAAEAAGTANWISQYGSLTGPGFFEEMSLQMAYENGQMRAGASLWQRPDLYIENSPIFCADSVITPLLMMHNKGDGIVSWSQAMEFFLALRRLNKKVWLLQYDNGNHILFSNDALDYTIRLNQFFDHYLKGTFPPAWMTEGVSATKKGVVTGLELDVKKCCGNDCPICGKIETN